MRKWLVLAVAAERRFSLRAYVPLRARLWDWPQPGSRQQIFMACRFYGKSLWRGELISIGESNRCAKITHAHSPCGMEIAGRTPDEKVCPLLREEKPVKGINKTVAIFVAGVFFGAIIEGCLGLFVREFNIGKIMFLTLTNEAASAWLLCLVIRVLKLAHETPHKIKLGISMEQMPPGYGVHEN